MATPDTGTVRIDYNGTTYSADYKVEHGIVTIACAFGSRSKAAESYDPEHVAKFLLREMLAAELGQLDQGR